MNGFDRVPSIQRLCATFGIDKAKAKIIRGLLKGVISPDEYQSVQTWVAQGYHEPKWLEKTLKAINEVLGLYGVEAIDGNRYVSSYWQTCAALYLNTGESCQPTLLFNTQTKTISICSWSDFVERNNL